MYKTIIEEGADLTQASDDLVKQVICIRHDLHMRMGKAIAQGAHASMMFLTKEIIVANNTGREIQLTDEEARWLYSGTRKICVRVESLVELMDIETQAKTAGLQVHIVTDAGHTEFHGEPTPTALAIGPDLASKIDPITGNLKLL